MKLNNKTFAKVLLMVLTVASSFSMLSCKDQPDKYEPTGGTPTIHYIRPADVNSKDSLLVEASPQMTIAIVGENLKSIKQMFFNDLEAVLNSSYITNNTLIVTTPKNIPNMVNDKITMITHNLDTVYYDFHIVIPAPVVSSMSNEHAKPGDIVTIYGSYFIDDPNVPVSVELPDGTVITDFTSMSQTALSFVMPNCTTGGQIVVTTIYGSTKSGFQYLDSRGMLFNFDTPNKVTNAVLGNHGWHPQVIEQNETSLDGNYLRLGDPSVTLDAEGGWKDGNFSFEYWPGNGGWGNPVVYTDNGVRLTSLADFSDFENMAYKFEICIPKENPWMSGAMQIIVGGVDKVTNSDAGDIDEEGTVCGGANNTYFNNDVLPRGLYRPWDTTGSFDTAGEWITVTIPINTFKYGFSGGAATGKLNAKDFSSLTIFVVGGGITGTECNPVIKIDNIRVVPNK